MTGTQKWRTRDTGPETTSIPLAFAGLTDGAFVDRVLTENVWARGQVHRRGRTAPSSSSATSESCSLEVPRRVSKIVDTTIHGFGDAEGCASSVILVL